MLFHTVIEVLSNTLFNSFFPKNTKEYLKSKVSISNNNNEEDDDNSNNENDIDNELTKSERKEIQKRHRLQLMWTQEVLEIILLIYQTFITIITNTISNINNNNNNNNKYAEFEIWNEFVNNYVNNLIIILLSIHQSNTTTMKYNKNTTTTTTTNNNNYSLCVMELGRSNQRDLEMFVLNYVIILFDQNILLNDSFIIKYDELSKYYMNLIINNINIMTTDNKIDQNLLMLQYNDDEEFIFTILEFLIKYFIYCLLIVNNNSNNISLSIINDIYNVLDQFAFSYLSLSTNNNNNNMLFDFYHLLINQIILPNLYKNNNINNWINKDNITELINLLSSSPSISIVNNTNINNILYKYCINHICLFQFS